MAFKSEEPERCIRLNVRAMLQKLRENGYEVASTSRIDIEEDEKISPAKDVPIAPPDAREDWRILVPNGAVRGWISIGVEDRLGSDSEDSLEKEKWRGPADAVIEGEVLGEVLDQRAA